MTNKHLNIVIIDDKDPQTNAMLQALYSRSPKGVQEHLNDVAKRGPAGFMERYYVQYGHQSIGDCGTVTLFFENISIIAAKAIQDWPLYNGQEASTRYMDMATRPLVTPNDDDRIRNFQENYLRLYIETIEALTPALKEKYPIEPGQSAQTYGWAINARAFDIARGFLPAGITTFVSWHTPLRTGYDHLRELSFHPLQEVRDVARAALTQLTEKYPASFSHTANTEVDEYLADSQAAFAYHPESVSLEPFDSAFMEFRDYKPSVLRLLENRPKKTMLHRLFGIAGQIQFTFPLDYGSFRDLQRHRSVIQPMPYLAITQFHPWYLEQLDIVPGFKRYIEGELNALAVDVHSLDVDKYEKQYCIPMGYQVQCFLVGALPAMVYIAELRSGQTVHPTLRVIAQQMGAAIKQQIPEIQLHVDYSPDKWSIRRGKANIIDTQAK